MPNVFGNLGEDLASQALSDHGSLADDDTGAVSPQNAISITDPQPVIDLWDRFKKRDLACVQVLEQAALALLEGGPDDDLRRRAEQASERLVESVATFGFARGMRLAREIEQILRLEGPLTQTHTLRLTELIVTLRAELDRSPTESATAEKEPLATQAGGRSTLLIIESDPDLSERLALEAMTRGMRVEAVLNVPAAHGALARLRPDVVVLDLALADALDAGPTILEELRATSPDVRVLVLTDQDSLEDRVRAASLGGHAFLRKPLPAPEVLDTVTEMLHQLQAATSTVMVVDDDPRSLTAARAVLESQGIKVRTLDDPRQFWEVLERSSPDLVLLGMDMPHFSGIDLCRAVRSDPAWRTLPVLFLIDDDGADSVNRVFAARADDYVRKPIAGPELVAQVVNRLERTQLHRSMADIDMLTGVANRRKASHVLSQYLRMAARYDQPLCLAILQVDDFAGINERYGHVAGDAVLQGFAELLSQTFRGEDVVARWGGGEFVVGMYGMRRKAGLDRLTTVLERFRAEPFGVPGGVPYASPFEATCSGAIVQFAEDGRDLPELYRNAEEVLRTVKTAGGNRIATIGWRPEAAVDAGVRKIDVLLVDNDEAGASLLLHALQTRGYRAEWLRDGLLAANALGGAGNAPTLEARVVLLDVDLPGLSGYDVLQRLMDSHSGSGRSSRRRTRVIMLTSRSTEHHVLKALELGAFDHVSKPFSLPVLLTRIRRALSD